MKINFATSHYSIVKKPVFKGIEKDVLLKCLDKGMSNRQIASHLSVNEHTIGKYLKLFNLKPAIKNSLSKMKEIINNPEFVNCTIEDITQMTGISGKTVIKWKKIHNVPLARDVRREKILKMFQSGSSISEIMEATKTNRAYVLKALSNHGFDKEYLQKLRVQNQIDQITACYEKGMNIPQIAEELGIAETTIRTIEKKYFGKHVFKMHKKTK